MSPQPHESLHRLVSVLLLLLKMLQCSTSPEQSQAYIDSCITSQGRLESYKMSKRLGILAMAACCALQVHQQAHGNNANARLATGQISMLAQCTVTCTTHGQNVTCIEELFGAVRCWRSNAGHCQPPLWLW
jgi:hypothetical protein